MDREGGGMSHSVRGRLLLVSGLGVLAGAALVGASSAKNAPKKLDKINHIVVIYEENHSFDNLYGGWEGVDGRSNADALHTTQVDQTGAAFGCLQELDVK